LFSVIPGFIFAVCLLDGNKIIQDGFFQGYTIYTWYSILFMSAGGLLVAVVVKFADSILKVIATTLSFVVSSIASMYIFDFKIGPYFVVGASVVLLGSWLYIVGSQEIGNIIPRFNVHSQPGDRKLII
jgi:solute carrier family 35 (UDP-sugar transporter), member A1/2/3